MTTRATQLSEVEFFEGLTNAQLEGIADLCEEVSGQEGEILFFEAHKADSIYVLLEGEIHIFTQLSSRPERITMSVIDEPYQIFSWSGLVAPFYHTASALCKTDSRMWKINGQDLIQLLQVDPSLGSMVFKRLTQVISTRLRHTRVVLSEAS